MTILCPLLRSWIYFFIVGLLAKETSAQPQKNGRAKQSRAVIPHLCSWKDRVYVNGSSRCLPKIKNRAVQHVIQKGIKIEMNRPEEAKQNIVNDSVPRETSEVVTTLSPTISPTSSCMDSDIFFRWKNGQAKNCHWVRETKTST